jgi:predicted nucleic acid-binding protein
MPSAIYWDTSALIKLYAPEADSDRFRDLLRGRSEVPAISFLHLDAVLAAGIQTIVSTDIRLGSAARNLGLVVL